MPNTASSADSNKLYSINSNIMSKLSILAFAIVIIFFIGAITTPTYLYPGGIQCDESSRKHEVCYTFMYLPALGHTSSGEYKVYNSGCDACRDPKVDVYWNFEICGGYSVAGQGLTTPICGLTKENSFKQYYSLADTCSEEGSRFYIRGQCP